MGIYVTLTERKTQRLAEIAQAIATLRPELTAFARANGGRFLLFGSAARGDFRYDSDLDLLLDFPPATEAAAWRFAEDACWARKLEPDVRPLGWCSDEFLDRVLPDAVTLG